MEEAMRPLVFLLCAVECVAAVPAAPAAFASPAGVWEDARSVLRAVEQAQSRFYAANGRYSASLRALEYRPPQDVVVHISAQGAGGWSAVVVGADQECAVYHGSAVAPRGYARVVGRIACRDR
jgi:hypothetical protein